ncbi:nucleoside hydrolase [Haematobacter massiliensis]|uniref:Nucleoside hydrolase n=1 Tax=Haematobacter massiliensis TaxID=195105 RepID=A0A086Y5S6_9RHOB|nr:nucleoside hydrolase [Haematobacter massiliensis]KFI29626.1 nucleoside hydrolase [Haematobacter massiliensis]OWJ72983.1 nucleoside hydrolase [Haematobacter massiliensis]OWJ88461.1 nucleoside hydrolase [Haematobacter massiliensis]QBJ25702.1 nucleoside hydrolase [Haematobacter massiliensis]
MGVWVDTDMGFDDIAAVLVLQNAGLEIDGMSLTFGNAALAQVCRNAAGAAAAFGWRFPIHVGRALPVMGRLETAQTILGETGIPTRGRTLPEAQPLPVSDAFAALCHWLEREGPHRILALGPLGNLASLALARPDLASRIDELVWMGGGLTRGNHTASAEFNAFADPEAAAIVLAQGLPLTMVDLDFCRQILATPVDVETLRRAKGVNAQLLGDLFGGFVDIALSRARPAMALYDPAAAVVFVRPDLITFQPARIDVECGGQLTRGRTVVETRASHGLFNARYAADCDVQQVRDTVLAALHWEAGK